MRSCLLLMILLCAAACSSTSPAPDPSPDTSPALTSGPWDVRAGQPLTQEQAQARLQSARAVIVGESHDDAWHHRLQEELYGMMGQVVPAALGMEMFQRPFQPALDAYVSGQIDEAMMLEQTEYKTRWGFDAAMYAPLWRAARERGQPILALNAPRELSRRISKVGLDGLSEAERAQLPPVMDLTNAAHRAWVRQIFSGHGMAMDDATFERFYQAQVCWDETMAHSAATYLGAEPARRVFIMAGSGHVIYDHGIPSRLARATGDRAAILTIIPVSAAQRPTTRQLESWRREAYADIVWVE